MNHRHQRALLAALGGSIGGAYVAAQLGYTLGRWVVRAAAMQPGFSTSVVPVASSFGAAWMATVLGCWLGLSWQRDPAAAATARRVAVGFPAVVIGWVSCSIALMWCVSTVWFTFWSTNGRLLAPLIDGILAILLLGGLTMLARWRALRELRDSNA